MTTHGYDLRQDPLTIPFAKRLFADADLVVTISEFNKKFMKKKYQLSSEKIKIIHCGIELARFSNTKCNLKFKEKKLKILNVGRLVPVKGHDILLNALAIVRKRGINFDLTIIGGGPLEEDLLQLTKQLCLEDCVHFIGAQSQKSVIEEMCNSDLFVLSSRSEGLPVVCMETMAMGAFISAPRINGIPELVENKINGLLVEPDNVEALAEAITWADNNREEVKVMCVSARSKVEKEFDRKKCTEDLLRLMERC
jgi:glycosyltransferase involved in cell wall biosynthesis